MYRSILRLTNTSRGCPEAVCQTEQMANTNKKEVLDPIVLDMGCYRSGSDRLLDCINCYRVRIHFRPFLLERLRFLVSGLDMMDFQPLT